MRSAWTGDGVETVCYAIPVRSRFRGITVREGMVLRGPAGWGEFCPFPEYDDEVCLRWLAAAVEAAHAGWPAPAREDIPVNCIVPVVDAARAYEIAKQSGCRTAKVKVADDPDIIGADADRVAAVRDALGTTGEIRVDVNGAWDIDTAVRHIRLLDRAAGGLQYVEQPCRTPEELATLRRRVSIRVAADESIRRAADPLRAGVAEFADVAVIKCSPLGGVRQALRVAESTGLPCVVSSALETSVGLAGQLALAGALPELDFACGLDTLSLLTGDVVAEPASLRSQAGRLPVPRRAPEPDPAQLDRWRMDADRQRWWRDRLARVERLARA